MQVSFFWQFALSGGQSAAAPGACPAAVTHCRPAPRLCHIPNWRAVWAINLSRTTRPPRLHKTAYESVFTRTRIANDSIESRPVRAALHMKVLSPAP